MEERDLPRLRRRREIGLEPRQLLGAARRVLERELGVERDEVHAAVVEAVVALGVIRIRGDAPLVGSVNASR